MKLEEIQDEWSKDCQIDITELDHASLNIPKLHNKYFKIFSNERLILRKMEEDFKVFKLEKYEFYTDGPTQEQIQKGWKLPPKGRILKADAQRYIDADSDIINYNLKHALQNEKVIFLESILKSIGNLGWQIRNAIEWQRFKNGA